jgi:transcriptional regulator with XRE-family HTH domain
MNSLVNRIRLGRRRAALSQSQLAGRLGVQRTAVAQWERKGGSRPSSKNMAQLAVELKVTFEWLATGRGPMELAVDADGDRPLAIDLDWYAHDALEQRLLAAYREVSYPANQRLVELVESMAGVPTRLADRDLGPPMRQRFPALAI